MRNKRTRQYIKTESHQQNLHYRYRVILVGKTNGRNADSQIQRQQSRKKNKIQIERQDMDKRDRGWKSVEQEKGEEKRQTDTD